MKVLVAAILSGILFYLSQGLADVWALAWFAPAPLLWIAYGDAPRWQVFVASVAAFAAAQIYLVQCYWGLIPSSIIAPLAVALCVTFGIAVVLSAMALRHGSPWVALAAFPTFWTAIEYLIDRVSPHGSFGALGYAEVSFPAGIQIASLFGVYAVTYLLCLCANAVALVLLRRWPAGGAGVAICAVALLFGFIRLAEPVGALVKVAALSDVESRNAEHHEGTLASEKAAAERYAAYIERLNGVRVVAIPEGAIGLKESEQQEILAPLAAAAKTSDTLVLAGTVTPVPMQNRAFVLLPDGAVESYAKRHPLLPFETEIPGRELGLLGGGYATQICKDMDFPRTVRDTAAHDVRLMIVPANDFGRDGWIHARMAVMRGVENGFAVLRSAFDGLETISDAQGRILASTSTMRTGMVVVTAEVPLGSGPTLYTRIGDVFPWLCVALSLLLGVRLLVRRRSTANVESVNGNRPGSQASS